MSEQILLVIRQPVQAAIEAILGRCAVVHAEKGIHRTAIEPLPVQAELAAGIDQAVDGQQRKHLGPRHVAAAGAQAVVPEAVELQLSPQPAAYPAIAEGARPPQLDLREPDLHGVQRIGRYEPIVREKAQLPRFAAGFIEDFERLSPGGLLGIVDLAEIQDGSLDDLAAGDASILDDAEVAV